MSRIPVFSGKEAGTYKHLAPFNFPILGGVSGLLSVPLAGLGAHGGHMGTW